MAKTNSKPIFSSNFLSNYIENFRLSSLSDIQRIKLNLEFLIKESQSGKFDSLKEEEIKSRFITTFFGDILGFNYRNSIKWEIREEKKSQIDGTKPDAALGFFYQDKAADIVYGVIELKDALTALDENQKRENNQTPVEQAFGYAPKMNGHCKWVIVTNIKEIRFYPAMDRSKCQIFYLDTLLEEANLKELLYLFHRDHFIKESEKSDTDKLYELSKNISIELERPTHIIDSIYSSLKHFEGFGFVDPEYIANIYPFNILKDQVWHYDKGLLYTLNGEIYNLLKEISIENKEIILSETLNKEIINNKVIDAELKLTWVFNFLNSCLIYNISALNDYEKLNKKRNKNGIGYSIYHIFDFEQDSEGITKNINIEKKTECDCCVCNFRNLEFSKLINKVDAIEGNLNHYNLMFAYANYLLRKNDGKSTYQAFRQIENVNKGIENNKVEYFIAKLNLKNIRNLIDYSGEDREAILEDIKSIDLDKVIYNEIEFHVHDDVKNYLIQIKENTFFDKIQKRCDEFIIDLNEVKQLYERGGERYFSSNLIDSLYHNYAALYLHYNKNFIIFDCFGSYKKLVANIFSCFVSSIKTPTWGIKEFNTFILSEAVLHINRDKLSEILKGTESLPTKSNTVEDLIGCLNNYINSYMTKSHWGYRIEESLQIYLKGFQFHFIFPDIFSKLFTILSRLEISKEQFSNTKTLLIQFIKTENDIVNYCYDEMLSFLKRKPHLFELEDLISIMEHGLSKYKYSYAKYDNFITKIPAIIYENYPEYKYDKIHLIKKAIINSSLDDGTNTNYFNLIPISCICNDECRNILFNAFEEHLDKRFSDFFYEELLQTEIYDYKRKNYFNDYSLAVNQQKGITEEKNGKLRRTNFHLINYILIIYILDIDFNDPNIKLLNNLEESEKWILNPIDYNYDNFNPLWLLDYNYSIILTRIKTIINIKTAVEENLRKEYNEDLAKIYAKFFI